VEQEIERKPEPHLGEKGQKAQGKKGTPTDPVYVVMQEPGLKSQLWRMVRTLALAFLLITGFSTFIEDKTLPKGLKEGMFFSYSSHSFFVSRATEGTDGIDQFYQNQ